MYQIVYRYFSLADLSCLVAVCLLFACCFSRLSIYRNSPRGPPEIRMPIALSTNLLNLFGGEFHKKIIGEL